MSRQNFDTWIVTIVTWKGEWEEYTFLDSLFEEKIVIWRKIIDERLRVLLEEEKEREGRKRFVREN